MRYKLLCSKGCGTSVWVRGTHEPDTNAVELDSNDPLKEACEHIIHGDYEIVHEEAEEFDDNVI